uniref:hypothetical protein n=1 Tax=Sporochnus bolleanus TaxID=461143 RepID=UPI002E75CEAB|nr:hypothetical protein V2496_pgp044 [Sporochnus bolleanus]WAM64904.1 hypothetical protein [Sporochnus bolleanus]
MLLSEFPLNLLKPILELEIEVKNRDEVEEAVDVDMKISRKEVFSTILTEYYFIIASNKFLLIDEPIEEILRERTQHYRRLTKITDFWFLKSPKFIDSVEFTNLKATLPEKCSAIVSTDKIFITWLKLRLNNVAMGSFVAPTKDIPSPLESNSR